MPIQAPQWTEFLSCPICCHEFDSGQRGPISLGCGHTVCRACLAKLQRNQCPYDQTVMRLELDQLPVNGALLSLVGAGTSVEEGELPPPPPVPATHSRNYLMAVKCIKDLALFLKPFSGTGTNGSTSLLSRPMQRKLVTLINCQLVEDEGRARAVRAARSLGERTVTELILQHQNHQQLSANLWAAVRARGCQFLGPAMQEEVLKLVLLALEDGSALSRKVLVMFVVQRLEPHFPQASKTSIGHVVQLLYRASCFKVSKREGDSSLMQLKEEFRTYEALRREHDAQIVQIATEAGLRIAPDQWSSLLYGDTAHKSHMQSIIDKLQTPQSFGQSVQELVIALQRTGDPGQLSSLRPQLELLAALDPSPDAPPPGWKPCAAAMEAVRAVVTGLVHFIQHHGNRKMPDAHHPHNAKYKTSMCRDLTQRGGCPRGNNCTFAHSEEELEKYRNRSRKHGKGIPQPPAAPTIKQHHQSQQHQSQPQQQPQGGVETVITAKNGEHAPVAVIQKTGTVEEILQPGEVPSTPTPFVHIPAHTQSMPVLPAPTPAPTIIQSALAPTPFHPAQMADYTYSSFPCQPPVFAPSQQPIPSTPTAVFSGQATAIVPDLYGGNAPTMLLNTAPVYNVTGHTSEFCIPIANTKPTSSAIHPLVSCWPDTSCTTFCVATTATTNSLTTVTSVATKSMEELKERKEAILNQLETIVGKEATHQVATQIENGEEPSKPQEFTSTYSIWTSGADFYIASKSIDKSYDPSTGYRTFAARKEDAKGKDDFIPFDPPLVSRFGPISRMSRTVIQPANPIQSSASNPTETTTTPTVRRPVPAISPMPQVLYQPGGYTVGVMTCIPTPLEHMNTLGHGIVDPLLSHLESSGIRTIPADPAQQECLRQQFTAVLDEKRMAEWQEVRLKEELSLVMNRIEVKRKEMEARNSTRDMSEKDLGDFENNWKFDFDDEKGDGQTGVGEDSLYECWRTLGVEVLENTQCRSVGKHAV
ncbi:roquin-1-like isoform X2 [Homarus americanus]|uniref:roquin-1-like isoform X2 n=1 Tax=Homarus americanus TaxID=6706 RepID=UPI001C456C45|nr:roquin-1-like isoform X2 [Homarus americanus]